jgi:hypothetical protein
VNILLFGENGFLGKEVKKLIFNCKKNNDPKYNLERRSVSFNANLDENIFNIYG